MFEKILIANRGEIAVRIIRTCRDLGIATVAVHSPVDRDAMHVRLADESYALGGDTAAESYLDIETVIELVGRSGADAVHPGYGFLSENADFARAVAEAGAAFIGPPADAIEVMGSKLSALRQAKSAGVPCIPGTSELTESPAEIVRFGEERGWPVAIKAVYGGGGRGMRVVHDASDAEEALDSARREARAYFGRDECYLERYLSRPRHVEVQVLCDHHGNAVHLGTRDCSAQRRHQKLIEEAPAPELSEAILAEMGAAAVAVAASCAYTNAGTVEFLVDGDSFFFLEMNTRLQVEHPVTEAITGIDLVAEQIQVASGAPLRVSQEAVDFGGHAIEVRVNAEDPAAGAFLPTPGTISRLEVPAGNGVRWDGGYRADDSVSQFYDNLVGKLICWGPDRATAIARTLRALEEFEIVGISTTIPADIAILGHLDFATVSHSTKWVEDELDLSDLPVDLRTEGEAVAAGPGAVHHALVAEVDGRRFSLSVWLPESLMLGGQTSAALSTTRRPARGTVGRSFVKRRPVVAGFGLVRLATFVG